MGAGFLAGCGLPDRWRGRPRFVVLDTAFGSGERTLAAWQAWHDDPARCGRLHLIAFAPRPTPRDALLAAHRGEPTERLAARLCDAWPPAVGGLHRLAFDDDRVECLIAFGDVASSFGQIAGRVDAVLLDAGDADGRPDPRRDPHRLKALARLVAPDATLFAATASTSLRDDLVAAGFEVHAVPGCDGAPEATAARYSPRHAPRALPRLGVAAPHGARVAIVGAGLAGSATAAALTRRHGIGSTVHEAASSVASGASNGAAGVFHGVVHRDDGRHARWHRAAAFAARDAAIDLVATHGPSAGATAGLLRVERGGTELAPMQATVDALALPPDYARVIDAAEASAIAGVRIEAPAWWFRGGGWLDPSRLVRHRLASGGVGSPLVKTGSAVASLRRADGRWHLLDASGRVIDEADVVVCANAAGAGSLLGASPWELTRVRGQSTAMTFGPDRMLPRVPIAGGGYAVATDVRTLWFGATASADDEDAEPRDGDARSNWVRACGLLPELRGVEPAFNDARVGWRCVSADRLPIAGAVASDADASPRPEQPWHAPRQEGLFVVTALGSRGIASAALGGAIVAARIAGAPLPAEADLIDAVDPARFASRAARRRA